MPRRDEYFRQWRLPTSQYPQGARYNPSKKSARTQALIAQSFKESDGRRNLHSRNDGRLQAVNELSVGIRQRPPNQLGIGGSASPKTIPTKSKAQKRPRKSESCQRVEDNAFHLYVNLAQHLIREVSDSSLRRLS
jgi:hypothetical protein